MSDTNDRIDDLYADLAGLLSQRQPGREDAELEGRVNAVVARLRDLQTEEARLMSERFAERLAMPLGAGREALDLVDAFLRGANGGDPPG